MQSVPQPWWSMHNKHLVIATLSSLALHALVVALASNYQFNLAITPEVPQAAVDKVFLANMPPPPPPPPTQAPSRQYEHAIDTAPPSARDATAPLQTVKGEVPPAPGAPPASMAPPPAPSVEEWAFAAKYTLKNSKGYRHNWGQQVRSMMGTAVEGPDQGAVRFRVEIGPDGALAKLETLWTTSTVVEQLARKAIENMPALPPTPTGKPLIFEKTISFSPFASDGPPIFRDDCLPDPPTFRNPFAWDGQSPQVRVEPRPVEKPDPQTLEECLKQLPRDTIEAESANDQRLLDQWGSVKSGR